MVLFFREKFMMMLADRLRGLRGTESQTAFAARFGLKQAIYSHYETGRKKPSLEVLVEMAKVLGATTDYLLGLSDIPPATAPSALSAPPREIKTGDNSPVVIGGVNGNGNIVGSNINYAPPQSTSTSPSTPKKKKAKSK